MTTHINKDSLASILTEGLNLGVVVVDADYRILLWNEWMEKQSGIKDKEALGQNIFDKHPDIRERKKDRYISECIENDHPFLLSSYFHEYLIPINMVKGDETIRMLQNVKIYPLIKEEALSDAIIIIEDVTNRVLHENEILRLSRVLKGIRNVNQLITRVNSEEELFNGACEILVKDIGYASIWIGLTEKGSFDVKPVAFAGIEPELFEELRVKWDDSEYGLGVTGKAIKTGKSQQVDSIQEDSLSKPWHDFAEKAGYQSSCSLPLKVDGRVIGTINVYSGERTVFYGEELKLLEEVTVDISFAIKVLQDRQKRRKAEEAVATEKERLIVTLQSIGDGVISTNVDGRVTLINHVAEDLTGWNREEAIGKHLNEVFHIINEKTRKRCENPVEKIINTGLILGLANDTVLIHRDGTERVIADSGAPILDKEGKIIGVVLVFRDVTEKVRMESELLRAQKLESIGILAGGIAHDLNNLLGAILGNVSLSKLEVDRGSELFEMLDEAEKASLRTHALTKQLLTFAKGGAPVKETASVSKVIEESSDFVLRGSKSRCECSIAEDLWPVEADVGQLSQVINNIVINANQAMPDGGVIQVVAENTVIEEGHGLPIKPGRFVMVSVKDQGVGIAKNHLPKIFDPYFSTKQEGSGLGLATAYSIIHKHDGHITVGSQLGVGTTFHIYLPFSEKEALRPEKEEEKPIMGQGKVLLMDDDEMLRKMAGRTLRQLGYEVAFAEDGAEAIELYIDARESKKPFDVVILDLTVPGGMGGKEAVQKLLESDPEVRAIVSSGYSNDPVMSNFKDYGFSGVATKPYDVKKLSKVLHEVTTEKGK